MGGTNHAVTYNLNSGVTTIGVQNAVNALISAGVSEISKTNNFNLKVTPNPVINELSYSYSIGKASNVNVEVFTLTGELMFTTTSMNQNAGEYNLTIGENLKLENGMYILKMTSDSKIETINFIVE